MNLTFWLKRSSTRPQLPLLMIVFQFVFFLNFQMCGVSLVSGGDGGAPDALLLVHAAALISACRIEPQVPPTVKRAKHAVRLCCTPLRTPPDLGLGRAGNARLG
jgi:hypothetical protein